MQYFRADGSGLPKRKGYRKNTKDMFCLGSLGNGKILREGAYKGKNIWDIPKGTLLSFYKDRFDHNTPSFMHRGTAEEYKFIERVIFGDLKTLEDIKKFREDYNYLFSGARDPNNLYLVLDLSSFLEFTNKKDRDEQYKYYPPLDSPLVKIGVSKNPKGRIKKLVTGGHRKTNYWRYQAINHPSPILKLLSFFENMTQLDEMILHYQFKTKRKNKPNSPERSEYFYLKLSKIKHIHNYADYMGCKCHRNLPDELIEHLFDKSKKKFVDRMRFKQLGVFNELESSYIDPSDMADPCLEVKDKWKVDTLIIENEIGQGVLNNGPYRGDIVQDIADWPYLQYMKDNIVAFSVDKDRKWRYGPYGRGGAMKRYGGRKLKYERLIECMLDKFEAEFKKKHMNNVRKQKHLDSLDEKDIISFDDIISVVEKNELL